MPDNSKDRIKFACKELEDALAIFGTSSETEAKSPAEAPITAGAQLSARQEKIVEIKRQLRDIREQLDSLSQ